VATQESYNRFWEELAVRLLHPTQLLVIEGISWVGRPLSPTLLKNLFDGRIALNHFAYHCNRLVDLDVLEKVDRVQVRGAWENFYDLVTDAEPGSA
jgi:hypothetical protein